MVAGGRLCSASDGEAIEKSRSVPMPRHSGRQDEEDFANETSLLEIEITARGHKCTFTLSSAANCIEFF